ncbi:MAG: DUF177 domain-containing protein, partial [Gammaproteobacteria bacterium]|nr:DUF177 domain-containing protein [Gammaproteobacteria bacterium]
MGNPLQDRRTPSEWAESGQVIEFSEKIEEFERFGEIVKGDIETLQPDKIRPDWRDTVVTGQLSFGFAEAAGRVPALQGRATALVHAVCQRCLEAFRLPLTVEMRLLLVADASAATIDGYEIWELEETTLRPIELVEEALIMALPLAAMHIDSENCKGPGEEQDPGDRTRPFADLRSQMGNTDKI